MMDLLKQEATRHGDKLKVLSVERLEALKSELEFFKNNEELNPFQKWIVDSKYQLDVPSAEFPIRSILIAAIPHPAYANVTFEKQGRRYQLQSLVMSDFERTEKYLKEYLASKGFHIQPEPNLPMKRLAARSGLAVYGRNNISYVEGMGSFLSYAGYFSDMPIDVDDWTEMQLAECCMKCNICFNNCPTGAIRRERFLIDNERCLSYFNEMPGDFPHWLPPSAHHLLYDCLKCQLQCPMNQQYADNVFESIEFNEEETGLIISGTPYDAFPLALQRKSNFLGLTDWLAAIPRNLQVLFELREHDF
jgi:epoxyqueuosine reductase